MDAQLGLSESSITITKKRGTGRGEVSMSSSIG
jgi:hypothetical protein